jgi:glycosyltransferase involved in cell wall biosynthesis
MAGPPSVTPPVAEASFNVVMAAYNASATVGAAIESVLGQSRGDFELVVVDDGSTDDTAPRVERYCSDPRVRLIRQRNLGPPAARNVAVGAGRGRYVTILDSDDLLMPTYLERIGQLLESNPQAGFAFADAWRLDDRSGRFWRRTVMKARHAPHPVPTNPAALLPALVRSNFVPIMFTVRRAALERVGAFRAKERNLAEDWELLLRLVGFGYAPVVVPEVLGVYRRNVPDSFTIDHNWMLQVSLRTLRVLIDEHPASRDVKSAAQNRIERLEAKLKKAARCDVHPTAAAARRRLTGPASVLRRDPLRRRAPREVAAAFPDLARPRR